MTRAELRKIASERLGEWCVECVDKHVTPIALVAIGHDHRTGEIHLFVPHAPDGSADSDLDAVTLEIVRRALSRVHS